MFVATEGEFAEENEISLLLVHEEEISEETVRVKAVFFQAAHFPSQISVKLVIGLSGNLVVERLG